MNDQNLQLKGGVIIIGSLLWQDNLNNNDEIRKEWRGEHLELENKILAKLPIRYGRFSKSGIYTMVFSTNCERYNRLGTGFIVPFKKNYINNTAELISETQAMSKAEGMGKEFVGGKDSVWASMCILMNKNKLQQDVYRAILTKWSERSEVDGGGKDISEYGFGKEKRSISKKGELQIHWPTSFFPHKQSEIDEIDFLIATSTKPQHSDDDVDRYPLESEIAESVRSDSTRQYFLNNFQNTITTFQDSNVINLLNNH